MRFGEEEQRCSFADAQDCAKRHMGGKSDRAEGRGRCGTGFSEGMSLSQVLETLRAPRWQTAKNANENDLLEVRGTLGKGCERIDAMQDTVVARWVQLQTPGVTHIASNGGPFSAIDLVWALCRAR